MDIGSGRQAFVLAEALTDIDALKKDHGSMFWLLYMNSAADPELTDFHEKDFRYYTVNDLGQFVLEEDSRDAIIANRLAPPAEDALAPIPDTQGKPLTDALYNELADRRQGWRFRS